MGDRFQVIRIEAKDVAAEVIEDKALAYRTYEVFVHNPVGPK